MTDDTRNYLERKLNRLQKQFRREPEVLVTQGFERGLHIIEVTLQGDGAVLRCQERSSDLRATIDSAVDKLETQWRRYKEKRIDNHRQHSPIKEEAEIAFENGDGAFTPRIVRRKSFPMKAMTPEEAAQQMELLSHSFFVFLNEETSQLAVLYRREGGDYGLIAPEI